MKRFTLRYIYILMSVFLLIPSSYTHEINKNNKDIIIKKFLKKNPDFIKSTLDNYKLSLENQKKQNAINAISDMFQAKPKVQKVADLKQTFRNIGDMTKEVVGPDGVPVFGNENLRFRLGVDSEKQEPKAMFTYNFPTV